jgi:hypothetical protein
VQSLEDSGQLSLEMVGDPGVVDPPQLADRPRPAAVAGVFRREPQDDRLEVALRLGRDVSPYADPVGGAEGRVDAVEFEEVVRRGPPAGVVGGDANRHGIVALYVNPN